MRGASRDDGSGDPWTLNEPHEVRLAIKYEHTSGYLPKEETRNINVVTAMMNRYGDEGWMFTGWAKEVLNGTFYMFVRPKE